MKNRIKAILIAIAVIIVVHAGFVTADCIRLESSEPGTKPLIITGMIKTDTRTEYSGLGYTVEYYSNGCNAEKPYYGAEFRLFDKILVWAWVE